MKANVKFYVEKSSLQNSKGYGKGYYVDSLLERDTLEDALIKFNSIIPEKDEKVIIYRTEILKEKIYKE